MSLDYNIHLKPFIKIPKQYENIVRTIKTCGEHENTTGHKFCPHCGKEIKNQSLIEKEELWLSQLLADSSGHYDENLISLSGDMEGDYMYIISNEYLPSDINTNENVYTEITPELINKLITEFEQTHAEDIKLLETKINQKVKVEFGFCYECY